MGKHATEALLSTGKHTITAITRPKSTTKIPSDVKVARLNYSSEAEEDVTALIDTLRGQQVLLIPMSHESLGTIRNLVHAAAKVNVLYILPNWYGHDANNKQLISDSMMTSLLANTEEIKNLGVSSYFMLVCNFWYEFSLGGGPDRYGFDFAKRSMTFYDEGNVTINMSTWPQCGRAIANLFSLKQLPDDDNDVAPTVSQFRDECVYISSFRLSQRDMFNSVKRVTGTSDADWAVSHVDAETQYKEGLEQVKTGNDEGWMKMGYSRMFSPKGDGDYETRRGLHNEILGFEVEDLDEATRSGIRMGENREV